MPYKIKVLLFCFFNFYFSDAQINPLPGSKLHYTQVMFEHENIKNASEYLLQVAEENGEINFESLAAEQKDRSAATLIPDLKFGKKYCWRYAAFVEGKQSEWYGPYRFETVLDTVFDANHFHCNVLKNNSDKNAGGILSLDYAKVIINRDGDPVWFIPPFGKIAPNLTVTRDLRITKAGTFTFLAANSAYEMNINGDIIWEAPNDGKVSGDSTELYHHDFRRLPNNNYMVLGEKYVWRKIPPGADEKKFRPENIRQTQTGKEVKILFGTIIEYNKNKEVVWSWNSGDYFSDKDLFAGETRTDGPRRDLPATAEVFGHMNAFVVDSSGAFVYGGFRDISRIVKIEKSTGKVVYSWGSKMPSGDAREGDGFFKNQHDLNIRPDGNILLFNNNGMSDMKNSSEVVEFSPPVKKAPSRITWTFDCKFDSLSNGKSTRNGGADYLPNNNMLVCMGGVNRVVELNKKSREIVWDGFFEITSSDGNSWFALPLYRVHHSSSLYPCYFTIQTKEEMVNPKTNTIGITIFNEGTNADGYSIFLESTSGKVLNTLKWPVLAAGQSQTISIGLAKLPAKTDSFVVSVISDNNPDLVKKINFSFIK